MRNRKYKNRFKQTENTYPYKSNFEFGIAQNLKKKKIKFEYESVKLEYNKAHTYTPDFVLANGIIIESKGRFTGEDRKKHLLVREQHPDKDIRFVFQRANQPLRKGSPNTYADWCVANNFKYADKEIPLEWIKE